MRLLSFTVQDVSRIIALVAFVVLSFISNACEKVPLLAPTDSTISLTLSEETTNVGLNSTLQVTAIVIEGSGTAPQNGTVVTFTTTLGHLDPVEARTTNGRASTTFHTGNRSGTATLRAFSGGADAGEGSASAQVAIGGAAGDTTLALRVEGTSNNGRNTALVAYVSDADTNPISGINVSFKTDKGQLTRGLDVTDANGEARTTLITSESASVTAQAGGATDTIDVVFPGALNLVVASPADGAAAEVGQIVTFRLTPDAEATFTDVIVNFGDGTPEQNLGRVTAERTFQHIYNQRGTYTITARGTTTTGSTATASVLVQINDRAPLTVNVTTPTPNVTLVSNAVISFTATATAGAANTAVAISRVDWDFGDGNGRTTTGLTTTYRYNTIGNFTVRVRVISTDGREGTAILTVRVTTG